MRGVVVYDPPRRDEAALVAPAGWSLCPREAFRTLSSLSAEVPEFVLPLLHDVDGRFQGLLEFLGVPYAGPTMASALLAWDPDFLAAVLPDDVAFAPGAPEEGRTLLAASVTPRSDDERWAARLARALDLSGWALVSWAGTRAGRAVCQVSLTPSLLPSGPFAQLLAHHGLSVAQVVDAEIDAGLRRHERDQGLRRHYKDKL